MTLEELKNNLCNNIAPNGLLIFKCEDNTFLANQYIDKVSEIKKLNINYLSSVEDIFNLTDNVFFNNLDELNVLNVDELVNDIYNKDALTNCIIKCNKIDKEVEKNLKDYIIVFPKLQNEHILEYALTKCKGVDSRAIEWLCEITNYDIFRLDNELEKISLFNEKDRNDLFNLINNDNGYYDLNNYTIFNLINAIVKRDKKSIIDILSVIDTLDIEPMGVITLLIRQFKNIIDIQLNNNVTYKELNMNPKQFNAIKYNCGKYNASQLVNVYELLTEIDYRLKSGLLDNDNIIDYVICNILK